jgi:uncharacterized Fe-S cluster-containing protein
MKFIYYGENLKEPATLEITCNPNSILNCLLNFERQDLQQPTFPKILTYRVWGEEFQHHNETLYDIWVEFTVGIIGKWEKFHKYEYMVRRVK